MVPIRVHHFVHATCGETRTRRLGYRLRCIESRGHRGPHRWLAELPEQR